ncbi:MAG: hypothetical protein E7500_02310 [Ruminococcus sp.]|nr:hypothetical protein [Ruminococcus sp.]
MTDEELQEYNRLVDRYNSLVNQNAQLEAEIQSGISNCYTVAGNIQTVGKGVTQNVSIVSDEVSDADEIVEKLYRCLVDLTERYFLFKNLSEASKMLTKYNDEYNTKFKFYNELRRITLGYVIGLDAHIVSSESLRKKVEKAYLANTDYWLAYAITAVMLWASNEKEASYRALDKALRMDGYKACVFFMLINIRFERINVAKNWYMTLLDKTDVNNMSPEWQHVLHAYLIGAMSKDKEFTDMASGYFKRMLEQTEATSADFSKKVIGRASSFAKSFIHVTENEYPLMHECCPEYPAMKELLASMEKIAIMAQHYDEVYQMEEDEGEGIYEQIENVLYDLINGYDEQEFKIVKNINYNEAILAAKGDMNKANAKYRELYGDEDQPKTFGDLMISWAFAEDYKQTDITVKRFALSYLKERISKGVTNHFEQEYDTLKDKYDVKVTTCAEIPPLELNCDENSYDSSSEKITAHFNKNKMKYILSDKYMKIYLFMCVGAILLITIAAMAASTSAFPVLLTLGLTLGIVSGFLVWRCWVDKVKELNEKCRLSLIKFRNTLDEMASWRKLVKNGFTALEDLQNAIDKF